MFLTMNTASWLVLGALVVIVILVMAYMVNRKIKGKNISCGECTDCSGCPLKDKHNKCK